MRAQQSARNETYYADFLHTTSPPMNITCTSVPFSAAKGPGWRVHAWVDRLWRRMPGGGVVHAVAAAEATGCSAKVPKLASECAGSCPSTSCCAPAGAGIEVNEEFPHAGSGKNLRSGACCRCFGPALSPITPPRCWDAAQRAPGHMALASPSMWMWMAAAVQTVECNSTWSLSLGFFCAALVPWVVLMDSTYWPRQRLA